MQAEGRTHISNKWTIVGYDGEQSLSTYGEEISRSLYFLELPMACIFLGDRMLGTGTDGQTMDTNTHRVTTVRNWLYNPLLPSAPPSQHHLRGIPTDSLESRREV